MADYDVIIVGAGPGGSSTALFTAKQGKKVLVLEKEKFPRDKICGDGIGGKSVKILQELGLYEKVRELPHGEGRGVIFTAPNGKELVIRTATDKPSGFICRRIDFDSLLFSEVKKHTTALESHQVFDVIREDEQIIGVKAKDLESGEIKEFYGKIVVGADGAMSVIAQKIGQAQFDPAHTVVAVRAYFDGVEGMQDMIELHFIEELLRGYFWIFPLEGKKANVGAGMLVEDQRRKKVDLKTAMFNAINSRFKERFKNATQLTEVRGWTLPLGSKRRKGYDNGVLLVGDACALIDPFSGEGIANAMFSGKLASMAIDKAFKENDFSAATLKYYDELLRKNLDPELQTMYKLQRLGSIKWLLNMAIEKASKNEEVGKLITSSVIAENAIDYRKKLSSPLFILKLLLS